LIVFFFNATEAVLMQTMSQEHINNTIHRKHIGST